MWKSVVQPGRPQVTVRRMPIACWITKATDRIWNIYCFSSATMATRTNLNISWQAHCLSCSTSCQILNRSCLPVWRGVRQHSCLQAVTLHADVLSEMLVAVYFCTGFHMVFEVRYGSSGVIWYDLWFRIVAHKNCVFFPENDNIADTPFALTFTVLI